MGWKTDMIREEAAERGREFLATATREQLIERLLDMEVALYPFAYTLGSLNEKSWRGTWASSKLFPFEPEKGLDAGKVCVLKDHEFEQVTCPENELHALQYETAESLTIEDGRQLADEFEVISVHQSAPAAYVGCGSIWMEDVRRAHEMVFGGKALSTSSSGIGGVDGR